MRVRILSGNLTGCVQDVPQVEGEVMVATGFAEPVAIVDEGPALAVSEAVDESPDSTPDTEPTPDA